MHDVSDLLTQRVVEGVGSNGGRVRNVMMGGGGGPHQLLELQGTFTHVAVEMKLPDGHWKGEVVIAKAPHEFDGHGHTCFFSVPWFMQHLFGRYKDNNVYKTMRHWRASLVRNSLNKKTTYKSPRTHS